MSSSFRRGVRTSKDLESPSAAGGSPLISRLSWRLRQSLRLGKRQSPIKSTEQPSPGPSPVAVAEDQANVENFTNYANIRISSEAVNFGTLPELKQVLGRNNTDDIKRFLRRNNWSMGNNIRANAWQEICRKDNNNYNAYKNVFAGDIAMWAAHEDDILPLAFINLNSCVINDYYLNEVGLRALYRLLHTLAINHHNLDYDPVLRSIIAIFLHYMEDYDVFACTLSLLKNRSRFMYDTHLAHKVSSYTLLCMIKNNKKSVYRTLKHWVGTSDEDIMANVLFDWPKWIFGSLPFEYLVRVMDCYLFEGKKILLRVSFALVYLWHKYNKDQCDLEGKTLSQRISLTSRSITLLSSRPNIAVQNLIDLAVGLRNFSSRLIIKFQKKYDDKLRNSVCEESPCDSSPAILTLPFTSKIISSSVARALMCAMPHKFQLTTPRLIFDSDTMGKSFINFWQRVGDAEQTLLIIKTACGGIFGAFCDASWSRRDRTELKVTLSYFGGGSCFLWKLENGTTIPTIYPWAAQNSAKANEMFMAAPDSKTLLIGGNAICIREDLESGMSEPSSTFDSPRLIKDGFFSINTLEVFEVMTIDPNERETFDLEQVSQLPITALVSPNF